MTFRECAIVMARTGICMLEGENIDVFYKYLAELFGRPVYTHEIAFMENEIKERSRPDFIRLCKEAKGEDE